MLNNVHNNKIYFNLMSSSWLLLCWRDVNWEAKGHNAHPSELWRSDAHRLYNALGLCRVALLLPLHSWLMLDILSLPSIFSTLHQAPKCFLLYSGCSSGSGLTGPWLPSHICSKQHKGNHLVMTHAYFLNSPSWLSTA